jgi:hypothetical protein
MTATVAKWTIGAAEVERYKTVGGDEIGGSTMSDGTRSGVDDNKSL